MPLLLDLAAGVLSVLVQFVLGFYAFWLVLRSLEGILSEDTPALHELDPLACDFTDSFVRPVARLTRAPVQAVCWLWLVVFAVVQVALERGPALL